MASKLPKPPRGATKAFKTYWEQLGTLLESEGRLNDVNLATLPHCWHTLMPATTRYSV